MITQMKLLIAAVIGSDWDELCGIIWKELVNLLASQVGFIWLLTKFIFTRVN